MDDDFSNADDIDLDDGVYDDEDIDTLDDDIANDVEPDNDDEDEEEEEEEEISIIRGITGAKQDIISYNKVYDNYYSNKKITKPFITKYERAKILGVRSEMIASGAPPTVNVPKGITSSYEIAKLEFNAKRIPLLIRRHLPNGSFEDWRLEDLIIN